VEEEIAMKPKGLLIAVVLLAVLGGLVWWSNKKQAATATDTANKLLSIPDDQFEEIRIKKATGEVQALRRQDRRWLMTQPQQLPADQDAVASMVSSLASLTFEKVVEEKAADLSAYGLGTPALDVEVKRKDGKTDRLLVGDDVPTGAGAYAKLGSDARVVTVSSMLKTSLDKRPEDLRDKRLLTFDPDKLTRVELQAKGQSIEFGKNGQNEWQIVKPRPLRADHTLVESMVTKVKDARMDVASTEDAAKGYAAAGKVAVVLLTDAAGTQTIEIRRDADKKNVFAKSSVVAGEYNTSADLAEAVDKTLEDFRNKKLFDFGFSDPAQFEIRGVTYTKSGDKWTSGGKTMNNTAVQVVIDKLRELPATGFADTRAGGTAFLTATVTANKRTEKVTIFRKGDETWAQREGDPSIYLVNTGIATELDKAAQEIKEDKPEPAKAAPKK
jgi:hypothetical protein